MTYQDAAIGAAIGAWAAAIGLIVARRVTPAQLPSGPAPSPLSRYVVIVADLGAAVGFTVLHPGAGVLLLSLYGLLLLALTLTALIDARIGTLPVSLLLGTLCVSVAFAMQSEPSWSMVDGALFIGVPLAILALALRGVGFGWGDVAMGIIAGMLLGPIPGWVAIATAAAVALLFSWRRLTRTLAFLPYMAAAIAFAIPLR